MRAPTWSDPGGRNDFEENGEIEVTVREMFKEGPEFLFLLFVLGVNTQNKCEKNILPVTGGTF